MNASPGFPLHTRRDFLSKLALAGAALPLAAHAAGTDVTRTEPRTLPTAQTTTASSAPSTIHVFAKPMHMMSYAETAQLVAAAGYGGIDYTVRTAQGHVLPERVTEDLPRAIEAAHSAGLKVEMITTGITSAREKHTETILRTAARHGVKFYRMGYWNYDADLGIIGTLQKLKTTVDELAALNASLGIHGALQNHSGRGVGGPVWDLYHLVKDVDPRWLGVQYDIRHATVEGGESWSTGMKLVSPWIRCTDIKDFKWQQSPGKAVIVDTPLGEGITPLDAYFKLYHELNLHGPISMHLEYPPFERNPTPLSPEERSKQFSAFMRHDLEVLRNVMARHAVT